MLFLGNSSKVTLNYSRQLYIYGMYISVNRLYIWVAPIFIAASFTSVPLVYILSLIEASYGI